MIVEIKTPSPGESITEVELAQWNVKDGDVVAKNSELGSIESDKASLPIIAEESGLVKLLVGEGETVEVGSVVCTLDTSVEQPVQAKKETVSSAMKEENHSEQSAGGNMVDEVVKVSPVAQAMMDESGLDVEAVLKGLRRIQARDVERVQAADLGLAKQEFTEDPHVTTASYRVEHREDMSSLRKKLAERLVNVRKETAMLTTFNEVDMTALKELRRVAQEDFQTKHGIKLGYMSFFTKAVARAIEKYPIVNAMIEGDEIVTPEYVDVSVAVSTPKGLLVPVIRGTEALSVVSIEKEIAVMAEKARLGQLSIDEMSGGTFTITNGGVFGSLLSTPILNPPQSAILGMHNIVDRPVALNGEVVIRPMMYIALSYDHRLIDGRDSVGFLKTVKELVEHPAKLFL